MIDFLLAHQAFIRETINGVAFVLFTLLTALTAVYLWDTWLAKEKLTSIGEWQDTPGVPAACVLFWICGSEGYRTFNVWLTYNLGRVPAKASLSEAVTGVGVGMFSVSSVNSTLGYLTAGVILCLALLRGIYVFSPPSWRVWSWKFATACATVFIITPQVFNLFGD